MRRAAPFSPDLLRGPRDPAAALDPLTPLLLAVGGASSRSAPEFKSSAVPAYGVEVKTTRKGLWLRVSDEMLRSSLRTLQKAAKAKHLSEILIAPEYCFQLLILC
ncbi:hypothetical protein M9458_053804 [Cirrhinus mrigala]|uniref:Uncharacterized protein n=1 Tax=Cirrhinus mrigala TaxID=683832 RepID=A0ABD0MPK0_CIRMR